METPYIDKFTVNLSEIVAKAPERYLALERENETRQVRQILNQDRKNSVAIIGEAGVGKTALVEGLAVDLNQGQKQDRISGRQIITLTLANLMQKSDQGSFATNLQALCDELVAHSEQFILFIDEMHQLIGTGSTEGSMMDAANILKQPIGRGLFQVIGATTLTEFHQSIEVDGAMERRFDKVIVEETSKPQTMNILKAIATGYAKTKSVQTNLEQLEFIYRLSDRFLTTQFFPEKAIMLLDAATTIAQLSGDTVLENQHVAQKIHDQFHVPMDVLLEADSERILKLPKVLANRVIGQQAALKKVERHIRSRAAGLGNTDRPLSFLFAGPTGVGKTETAKALSTAMFGSDDDMIRFDMSEFKYAERSATTFLDRLTESVKYHPYSVLLLDEVEKADPLVLDLLLQVLDEGRLTNKLGRTINFKDLIVVITTNLGHNEIEDFYTNTEAYKHNKKNQETFMQLFESILRGSGMRREFIKRITSIVIYEPLMPPDVFKIINIKLGKLQQRVSLKGFNLIYDPTQIATLIPTFADGYEMVNNQKIEAHPIQDFLLERGYKTTDGVRPLDDAINEYLESVISEAILEEQFTGKSNGHSFIFRAQGEAPHAELAHGRWQMIYSQFELSATQKQKLMLKGDSA